MGWHVEKAKGSVTHCWNFDCHCVVIPLIGNGRHDVVEVMNRNCDGSLLGFDGEEI